MSDRAVIFDKDGTLTHNNRSKEGGHYYILKPEQIEWVDGATELLDLVNELGYIVAVVTMQNWIKSQTDYALAVDICEAMGRPILKDGIISSTEGCIDEYIICTSKDESDESKAESKAKAIIEWATENDIDLSESIAIGDTHSDILAYNKAGIGLVYQIILPYGDSASLLAHFTYKSLLDLYCDFQFNRITGGYLKE